MYIYRFACNSGTSHWLPDGPFDSPIAVDRLIMGVLYSNLGSEGEWSRNVKGINTAVSKSLSRVIASNRPKLEQGKHAPEDFRDSSWLVGSNGGTPHSTEKVASPFRCEARRSCITSFGTTGSYPMMFVIPILSEGITTLPKRHGCRSGNVGDNRVAKFELGKWCDNGR